MNYNFKRYAPFTQRGANFPASIIRVRRTSLVISSDVAEEMGKVRTTDTNGNERIRLVFGIDKRRKAVQLSADNTGYLLQLRQNGNAYLNTTRLKFGLPIGDYKLVSPTDGGAWIFELAK